MGPRACATMLLVGVALSDLAFRVAQVALPLVVLLGTGSASATGLVGGASGVPVLLSPWWSKRLRHRVRSGRMLALCYVGELAALTTVAGGASSHHLSVPLLLAAGGLLGTAESLSGPGRDALMADLGDQIGTDRALVLLTIRDFFRRGSMVVGAAIGGAFVAQGHLLVLLWSEVAAVACAAVLALPVPRLTTPALVEETTGIWSVVRTSPEMLRGWCIRGTGCLLWFAFSLGLAVLGVEQGDPGSLMALGLASYGVGAVLGTVVAVRVLRVLPALPTIAVAWTLCGLSWVVMGLLPTRPVVALTGFLGGLVVVVGNTGVTAQIARGFTGAERRTLLAGQSVVVNAASSVGLLAGGSVLAVLGGAATLVIAGAVLAVVPALVTYWPRRAERAITRRSAQRADRVVP